MKNYKIIKILFFILICSISQSILALNNIVKPAKRTSKTQNNVIKCEGNCNEFVVLHSRRCGMFSIFGEVLYLCKRYDDGAYKGIEVDFRNEGIYYDESKGNNWWSYYCEPIKLGQEKQKCTFSENVAIMQRTVEQLSRQEAKRLIDKYIHVKGEILQEVSDFVDVNFTNKFVICVHYRGTDKSTEAPRVNYENVIEAIQMVIKEQGKENIKIFVATDEIAFLEYIEEIYGSLVCYNPNVARSDVPLHKTHTDPYQSGRDALVDSLLLSSGSCLIRTSSNLSLWSTFLNPTIPVIELSQRHAPLNRPLKNPKT